MPLPFFVAVCMFFLTVCPLTFCSPTWAMRGVQPQLAGYKSQRQTGGSYVWKMACSCWNVDNLTLDCISLSAAQPLNALGGDTRGLDIQHVTENTSLFSKTWKEVFFKMLAWPGRQKYKINKIIHYCGQNNWSKSFCQSVVMKAAFPASSRGLVYWGQPSVEYKDWTVSEWKSLHWFQVSLD